MSGSGSAIRWVVRTALSFRVLVLTAAAAILVLGVVQVPKMPMDVLPEFRPPTVEIQTEALGLSAAEVEQLITVPLEADLLNGVAYLDEIRSESVPGVSSIELVFDPGTDLLDARQVVAERLTQAHALPNVSKPPAMLQPLSSTNRVLMIGLSSEDLSLMEMSVLARWKIRPYLTGVPGVANVAIWGQRERQLQVQVDPARLRENGVSLQRVVETTGNSLWVSPLSFVEASTPGTGGFIDTPNQRLTVQHISPLRTADDLSQVAIEDTEGRTLRLGDVTDVVEDHQPLIGDAVVHDAPGLMLVIEKFPGTSTVEVTEGVESALERLAPAMPGVTVDTSLYRPADFIEGAVVNLAIVFLVGLALLVLVVGVVMQDWRAVLISLVTVPVAVSAALVLLYLTGASLNVMVLSGLMLALAVVVDDAIVDVDRIRTRLRERTPAGAEERSVVGRVLDASAQVRSPLVVATLAVVVAAVPLLLVAGLAGAFARPMVVSYGLAVLASAVVALTLTPVLVATLLPSGRVRREARFLHSLRLQYSRLLERFVYRPWAAYAAIAVVAVAGLAAAYPQVGDRDLLSTVKERDVLVEWDGPPGTSHTEMARITARASQELRSVPGVRDVGGHMGRAIASDQVTGVHSSQLWVSIDSDADYDTTIADVDDVVTGYPGLFKELRTYPEEQLREVQTGLADDLVVRVYGLELAVLEEKAAAVRDAMAGVDGVVDARVEQEAMEPTIEVEVNLDAAEEHGIKPGDVRRAAAMLLSGVEVGSLFEEQKVFEVVVWGVPEIRSSVNDVENLQVDAPDGSPVRVGDVADVRVAPNPSVIRRDSVSRRVDVVAGIESRGTDDVIADVETAVDEVDFPLEYHAEVLDDTAAGLTDGRNMLAIALAAALAILLFLQATFASWRLAALVVVTLPLAVAGGVLAGLFVGGPLTLVSGAALLAVLGVAARQTILLVLSYQAGGSVHDGGAPRAAAVVDGAGERLVAILTSALATVMLLLPVAVVGGQVGLDLIQPAAVIVIGGLVTVVFYSLFLVPALYLRFAPAGAANHQTDLFDPAPAGADTSAKG